MEQEHREPADRLEFLAAGNFMFCLYGQAVNKTQERHTRSAGGSSLTDDGWLLMADSEAEVAAAAALEAAEARRREPLLPGVEPLRTEPEEQVAREDECLEEARAGWRRLRMVGKLLAGYRKQTTDISVESILDDAQSGSADGEELFGSFRRVAAGQGREGSAVFLRRLWEAVAGGASHRAALIADCEPPNHNERTVHLSRLTWNVRWAGRLCRGGAAGRRDLTLGQGFRPRGVGHCHPGVVSGARGGGVWRGRCASAAGGGGGAGAGAGDAAEPACHGRRTAEATGTGQGQRRRGRRRRGRVRPLGNNTSAALCCHTDGAVHRANAAAFLDKNPAIHLTLIDVKEGFEYTPSVLRAMCRPETTAGTFCSHAQYVVNGEVIVDRVVEVAEDHVLIGA